MTKPAFTKQRLPIDAHLTSMMKGVFSHPVSIIQASPGSGKTTRLPIALSEQKSQVWVLEPRRIAAKVAAERVAFELGQTAGGNVGYHFRFERAEDRGGRTRLLFLTEGMLLRRLAQNPTLEGVQVVVLDEFHERHWQADLALALLLSIQKRSRRDLKIVVLSATLEISGLENYFLNACGFKREELFVSEVEAPFHGVDILYEGVGGGIGDSRSIRGIALSDQVVKAIGPGAPVLENKQGRVLVFLPGKREIESTKLALESAYRRASNGGRIRILSLHGEQSKEEQALALKPFSDKGHGPDVDLEIILSTNVAESSVTIDQVVVVVDSGWVRRASFSSGVHRLLTERSSKASCVQRAHRAGRQSRGVCIRLFSKSDFDSRPHFDRPEIERVDLCEVLLSSLVLGVDPTRELVFLTPPGTGAMGEATSLLEILGAIRKTDRFMITDIGERLSSLPLHPRWGRVLIEARRQNLDLKNVIHLVVLLSGEGSAVGDWLDADEFKNLLGRPLQGFAQRELEKSLVREFLAEDRETDKKRKKEGGSLDSFLLQTWPLCLAAGFLDRIAEISLSSGVAELALSDRQVLINAENLKEKKVRRRFALLLDVREQKFRDSMVSSAGQAVEFGEELFYLLDSRFLEERTTLRFNRERKRVEEVRATYLGRLAIEDEQIIESKSGSEGADDTPELMQERGRILAREVLGAKTLDQLSKPVRDALEEELSIRRRYFRLKGSSKEKEIPAIEHPREENTWLFFLERLGGLTSAREIESVEWSEFFARDAEPEVHQWFPRKIELKGVRRSLSVSYPSDLSSPPQIEGYLQNFFGIKSTPSVAGGKVPLSFILWGPHGRALQVTQDLKGFFERTYPELRKTLSREYPRHHWPEDPFTAEPILHKPRVR